MAINFDPFSQFNVEPSSFSLPAGMDMNQAATTNAMMQPVSLLGQQGVSAPQQAPQSAPSSSFNEGNLLSGLASLGAALNKPRQTPGGLFGLGSVNIGSPVPMNFGTPDFSNLDLSGVDFEPLVESSFQSPDNFGVDTRFSGGVGSTLGNLFFDKVVPGTINLGRDAVNFFTGEDIFSNSLKGAGEVNNLSQFLKSPEVSDSMKAESLSRLNEEAQSGSPQANFLNARAQGVLTPEQINEANAFAASMGTTFDPNLGYSRTPFLESQEFETPTINSILNLPAGVGDFGMKTDAQGRMISQGDDRSAFNQASLDRLARLEARDVRPGETITERDTRIADSRTEGADEGSEMTFEEARKFVPKGEKESTKAYNERIKAFQTEQNSRLNKLKENLQKLKVTGQELNNDRVRALIVKYARSESQKYGQVLAEAQAMFADGRLKDETEMALYIIEEMGDDVSSVTDKSDGSKSSMIDKVIQTGPGGSPSPQKSLDDQAYDYAINNPNDPRSQEILNRLGRK
jgi:hypothetical protein